MRLELAEGRGPTVLDVQQKETIRAEALDAGRLDWVEVTNGHVVMYARNGTYAFSIEGFSDGGAVVHLLLVEVGDSALAGVVPIARGRKEPA